MEVDGDRQRQSKGRGPETQEGECHERGAKRNERTGWETEALSGQDRHTDTNNSGRGLSPVAAKITAVLGQTQRKTAPRLRVGQGQHIS